MYFDILIQVHSIFNCQKFFTPYFCIPLLQCNFVTGKYSSNITVMLKGFLFLVLISSSASKNGPKTYIGNT